MSYQIPYQGNLSWLRQNTIYFARHGSHAYGTNIESSDEDFKGICIPPKEYFLGYHLQFEQAESNQPDLVIYDIRKFIKLAANANPSIIEVMWADPEDVLIQTWLGEKLCQYRHLFLSKKVRYTFQGYAFSQLKRINLHRHYLLDPPTTPPTRQQFKLPERTLIPQDQLQAAQAQIKEVVDRWELGSILDDLDEAQKILIKENIQKTFLELRMVQDDLWIYAARYLGYDDNFIHLLQREKQYFNSKKDWDQFQSWKKNRNPARAQLEQKFGFDCKHALHLVRLSKMCYEILNGQGVIVRRPDRKELLAIRNGAWDYQTLISWFEQQNQAIEDLYQHSNLPHHPDHNQINELCVELVDRFLR